jgi:hypothetical protein
MTRFLRSFNVLSILLVVVAQAANAAPVTAPFVGDARCDPILDQTLTHELGGAPFTPFFPIDETILVSSISGPPICTGSPVGPPDWEVTIVNFGPIAYTDLFFVADLGNTIGNADGTIFGQDAFRIDAIGPTNANLLFESIAADGIFDPTESWTFLLSDFLVTSGPPGPPLLFSIGVAGAYPVLSNASIVANPIPIPAAVWLFGSALGLLGWMKRRNASFTNSSMVFFSIGGKIMSNAKCVSRLGPVIFMISMFYSVVGSSANLFLDPSFESYNVAPGTSEVGFNLPGPWQFTNDAGVTEPYDPYPGTGFGVSSATIPAHDGDQYVSTYAGTDYIVQEVTLSPGQYELSIYAAYGDIGAEFFVDGEFAFAWDPNPNVPSLISPTFAVAMSSDWTQYSMILEIVGPSPETHLVGIVNSLTAPYLINYDSASLTSLSSVPVPAAAWLFGSALGLLGWMRRKAA